MNFENFENFAQIFCYYSTPLPLLSRHTNSNDYLILSLSGFDFDFVKCKQKNQIVRL